MTTQRGETIRATTEDDGQRVDVVLGRRVTGLSRRMARKLGLEGAVRIDGRRVAPSTRVHADQSIEIRLPTADEPPPPPTLLHLSPRFVYVSKPAGLHTVAQTPDEPGCLSTHVGAHYPECRDASDDPREAGAVHRLDRSTSGVVAFARDRATWTRAREAFTLREVTKHYVALCSTPDVWPPSPEGALQGWVVEDDAWAPPGHHPVAQAVRLRAPIGRGESRQTMAVRLDGASARTAVVPIAAGDPPGRGLRPHLALAARLETGLRHQARVHLAWCGAPIVGDVDYGGEPSERLHLHALSIDFSQAFENEPVVDAPPPAGFFEPG